MTSYKINIIFSKSKPLIILNFENPTELLSDLSWKKKFKKINDTEYHIATTIIEKVFDKNEDLLGKWHDAKFENDGVSLFYGFTKIKGMEVHSLDLSKRFVNDWLQEYTQLIKYTVNRDGKKPPITAEVLYDGSLYGNGTVGNITMDEYNCLRKIINPDGEIIQNIKKKLGI